jgi:ABC-type multidrug transport system fused ATPase/permease subunit
MRSKYQEHFRRVVSWRKGARWAVILYPIFTAIFLAVPFLVLRGLFKHLYKTQPEWFVGVLPVDSSSFVLQLCSTLAGVALVGGSVLGLSFGVVRSRALFFEAERVEMNVRQSFYLNRLARKRRKKSLA